MIDIREAAERADVIIEGYAVDRVEAGLRVTNLTYGHGMAIISCILRRSALWSVCMYMQATRN